MIKIDEIYDSIFWQWIRRHRPGTRLFYCWPFGSISSDNLCNQPVTAQDHSYVFVFDQEPIIFDLQAQLFQSVKMRNLDTKLRDELIVTSEVGMDAHRLSTVYGWRHRSYFFHGWAALDWYRGYDRSYHIQPPHQRQITHTFLSPNRIFGGARQHRVMMLRNLIYRDLMHNHVSFPAVCPAQGCSLPEAAASIQSVYPDILELLSRCSFPRSFDDETGAPMTSYTLDLWHQAEQSLVYLVTETVAKPDSIFVTEKTFKPICLGMPFLIMGCRHTLRYLKQYGFQTFSSYWSEDYDNEPDMAKRSEMVADILAGLDALTIKQRNDLYHSMLPVIQHNRDHFYSGAFESQLAKELHELLHDI